MLTAALAAAIAALVIGGALLLGDQPGLRADYFALGAPWEGRPYATAVGAPALDDPTGVLGELSTKAVFSVRWSGWWDVPQSGEQRFSLAADDGGFLRIDGRLVVNSVPALGELRESGSVQLERGFHAVEVGLYQSYGDSWLTLEWAAPGVQDEQATALPLADLYSARPLLGRKLLRRLVTTGNVVARQLLGVMLLLGAAALLPWLADRSAGWTAGLLERWRALDGPRGRWVLLSVLFAGSFAAIFPHTGTLRGGDDTAYLRTAVFTTPEWYYGRYCHVYLLKLFTWLVGGEPLHGVRVWWSFVFAATVAGLAVAVRSIGPRLQVRTLVATLFVLFSQPIVLGLIGSGFADFSAMMFVTLAVAVCLHGFAVEREEERPQWPWHALAVGALTIGAFRSKEVGAVLGLLPALFLIGRGPSLDLRGFVRKSVFWALGAAAALLALMSLDAWILGDFFFTLNERRLAGSAQMNFPPGVPMRGADWLGVLLAPEMRNLWLTVSAAALTAGALRRRLDRRLLHLLPIVYLIGLILLYIRLPHPFSNRMLIPILPVACLMAALVLHDTGLDEIPWRKLLHPLVLFPFGLAAAGVFLLFVPYLDGRLDPASVLPAERLLRYGWTAEHFVVGVLLPAGALGVAAAVALGAGWRRVRVAALAVGFLALFGPGFELCRVSLAQDRARQTGDLLTYPWRVFRSELAAVPAANVGLSRDLERYYQMTETTHSAIAKVSLNRPDVGVRMVSDVPLDARAAIASPYAYRRWVEQLPALAATAHRDPAGFLVLVRPRAAVAASGAEGRAQAAAVPEPSVHDLLDRLSVDRDAATRHEVLRRLLDEAYGPDSAPWLGWLELDGHRLRAAGVSGDGWTLGDRPAGLIVSNRGAAPLVEEISLAIFGRPEAYPIRVSIDDGETVETVEFSEPGTRNLRLRPVPARSQRLVVVRSDTAWVPGGGDRRVLGVNLASAGGP